MLVKTLEIINKLGLHARASAKWVNLASQFNSHIELHKGSQQINAKSIMGVMLLAASKGTELKLLADGDDEHQAVEALSQLVADRFGETE